MRMLLLSLGICTSLFAIDMCERCWEVGAEYLYWKPCSGSYVYGVAQEGNTVRDLVVKPSYDSGFRLFGATYTWDSCHCFWLDWTYLRSTDSTRKNGSNVAIFPNTTSGDGRSDARLKFRYNKVNVRAGRYISCYCESNTYLFGGVRYVDIEQKRQAYFGSEKSDQKAEWEGAAFEAGIGTEIKEPCNLYVTGHIAGVMGIGERRLRQTSTVTEKFTYRHPSETACLPGIELRLGVKYRYACDCFCLHAEVGYHLDHYFNAMRLMSGGTNVAGVNAPSVPATDTFDVGFAGPYVNLAIRF